MSESEVDIVSRLRDAKNELEFQLRVAEIARIHNVSISKEQGYAVLALINTFLEKTEKEKEDGQIV